MENIGFEPAAFLYSIQILCVWISIYHNNNWTKIFVDFAELNL